MTRVNNLVNYPLAGGRRGLERIKIFIKGVLVVSRRDTAVYCLSARHDAPAELYRVELPDHGDKE